MKYEIVRLESCKYSIVDTETKETIEFVIPTYNKSVFYKIHREMDDLFVVQTEAQSCYYILNANTKLHQGLVIQKKIYTKFVDYKRSQNTDYFSLKAKIQRYWYKAYPEKLVEIPF
jgi:hypothetical protein